MQFPPRLQPGDLVKVVAPSGALRELETFYRGIEIWRSHGYRVEFTTHWDSHYGYLAGTDSERRQGLSEAWNHPTCKAILCARGGYGSARLLEKWTWGQLTHPKWIIGFSDITGLLWSLARVGIAGVHGPLLTTLADEPQWSIDRLFDCVEGRPLAPLTGQGWGGSQAIGQLLPANLTVATHLLATPFQPSVDGVILALEDVTEAPYRIDRMLTQWRLMGVFQKVRGIALGRFSRCEPPAGSSSWTVEEVLRDRLGDLNIPIVGDLPFGHDGVNAALPVGQRVRLDGDEGKLEFMAESA